MSVGLSLYLTAASIASLHLKNNYLDSFACFHSRSSHDQLTPEHLDHIGAIRRRHIVEGEVVLASKGKTLGRHLMTIDNWPMQKKQLRHTKHSPGLTVKFKLVTHLHVLINFVGTKQRWDCRSILTQFSVPGAQVFVRHLGEK